MFIVVDRTWCAHAAAPSVYTICVETEGTVVVTLFFFFFLARPIISSSLLSYVRGNCPRVRESTDHFRALGHSMKIARYETVSLPANTELNVRERNFAMSACRASSRRIESKADALLSKHGAFNVLSPQLSDSHTTWFTSHSQEYNTGRGSTVVARAVTRIEDACEIATRSNLSDIGDNERR